MVTCNECGKLNGNGKIGTFWICGDCRVGEPADALKIDLPEQTKGNDTNRFSRDSTVH